MNPDGQIFVDSLGLIGALGSVARIDFVALSPAERDASPNPKMAFSRQMVIPLDEFLAVASEMREAGVIGGLGPLVEGRVPLIGSVAQRA